MVPFFRKMTTHFFRFLANLAILLEMFCDTFVGNVMAYNDGNDGVPCLDSSVSKLSDIGFAWILPKPVEPVFKPP